MLHRRIAAAARACALVGAMTGMGLMAAEGDAKDVGTASQDYLDQKAELENMITSRDVDLYEMSFKPIELDRVVLRDRLGREQVFHYLTFRLRNEVTDDTKKLSANATRYNEILQNIATQYESASVENGVQLKVDGEEVLNRPELGRRTRKVGITVIAYDENGSRLRLLDDPIGSGPQEQFNFVDLGETTVGSAFRRVREKVEEKVGRKLLTCDEIRGLELPPFDAASDADPETGFLTGEAYGVLLFNRLSIYGDAFTIEIRGLNNKLRVRQPDTAKGMLDNYLAARVLRRVYVLHYSRPGDEFFEDMHPFTLTKAGWEWVDTFQRLEQRANVAYTRYFLDNIATDKGAPNASTETEFWPYYNKVRETRPMVPETKLPDLEKTLKER